MKIRAIVGAVAVAVAVVGGTILGAARGDEPIVADWVFQNGTVFDGTGAEGRKADVAIRGDRIVAVGAFAFDARRAKVVDASGLIVAPGFIDLHTHSDEGIARPKLRSNRNYVAQGVTTVVTGNCGSGPIDIRAYFAAIESGGAPART